RPLAAPRGLGGQTVTVDDDALSHLVNIANGDARIALNGLEAAGTIAPEEEDGRHRVTLAVAEEASQRRGLLLHPGGGVHYGTIFAFIKSLRGSDPDAAVYWLARMLAAGEDPRFIARRMVVHAAEDVRIGDPTALGDAR